MEEILTRCGFRCDLCPAYDGNLRTVDDRRKISDGWFKYYGFRIAAEEIGCVGCWNEGKHADTQCPIRPCVIEYNLENCAYCKDFGCEKLKSRMDAIDAIEKKFPDLPADDYNLFIRPYKSRERLALIREKLGGGT
jgi:hypothetical protein